MEPRDWSFRGFDVEVASYDVFYVLTVTCGFQSAVSFTCVRLGTNGGFLGRGLEFKTVILGVFLVCGGFLE